jgi:hypothetical protein
MMKTILLVAFALSTAQAPTGMIAGEVRDPARAVVAGARVKAMNVANGVLRTAVTSERGDYIFPSLFAGDYQLSVEVDGFQTAIRPTSVEAGSTTTADFDLRIGNVNESITVDAASPPMRYDSHTVAGAITRGQIEDLPLNGRSFLELAKLEPGVQPPTRASSNRMFLPVLGAPGGNSGRGTRITIDGGSVMAVGNGGSSMGFSQEAVQEFQVSTVNFDLTTGPTVSGAVNAVTRAGGNQLHGSAFYFFRDHTLAAYPALRRDLGNPDPFFQRRQFGFAAGGPIRRDRFFFFTNWERNEQRGVVDTNLSSPDFAHFNRITVSPLFGTLASVRLDGRISSTHSAFVRHSHDGSRAFGPNIIQPTAYPSNWSRQTGWADQSLFGLTSVLRPTLVNDLRFSYFFVSSSQRVPEAQDCAGCVGLGAPSISTLQTGLLIGSSDIQRTLTRRFQLNDFITWQHGTHRVRFGTDWEHNRGGTVNWSNEPASIVLFSPSQADQAGIPVPEDFRTLDDILRLPLQTVTVAVGDPRVAQANGSRVRTWDSLRVFFDDAWRVRSGLTLNYGLAWRIDRNLNYDLSKPALLAPILGVDGLGPTQKQWKDLSPTFGLAWMPAHDVRTVVRAGAGIFYDFLLSANLDVERAALAPTGTGRQTFQGSSIPNTLPGILGAPIGGALDFRRPTAFTGADFIAILPTVRASLLQNLSGDPAVQQIQVTKTLTGGGLNPSKVPTASALHVNSGVQREIAKTFVVSADFVYRRFSNVNLGSIDLNHFNSARGPVIPKCTVYQRSDPQALCSNGRINVSQAAGQSTYRGLLLRADKRFAHGFQFLGSWAWSKNTGTNIGSGFNLNDWLENRGPLSTDLPHILNFAGVARLPQQFELALNFSYSSAPPFSAYVGIIDFNGDGTTGDLLPGSTVNAFNRGLGKAELNRLVESANQTYAGKSDAQGSLIPMLTLPDQYQFGDNFQALDLRVTRAFALRENWQLKLIAEVFNLYNAANLTGHSGDLTNDAFGQPGARSLQIFGSGGPRTFQLAIKAAF